MQVRKEAIKAVKERGGNISDETEVLSEYVLQFGAFRGQTFCWMLENAMGYSAWLVDSMRKETATAAPLSQNKVSFKAFVESFQECRQVINNNNNNNLLLIQRKYLYEYIQMRLTSYIKIILK